MLQPKIMAKHDMSLQVNHLLIIKKILYYILFGGVVCSISSKTKQQITHTHYIYNTLFYQIPIYAPYF